jgi:hypothetical protein
VHHARVPLVEKPERTAVATLRVADEFVIVAIVRSCVSISAAFIGLDRFDSSVARTPT